MFGFGKKKTSNPPEWNQLSHGQKVAATRKMIKALAGARYKIVSGTDEWQRERGIAEHRDEDEILNSFGRGKMIDLARNAARNSSTFNGILKQFDLNAVGTTGGKAILDFPDGERILKEFSKWTREADYFDGLNFNTVLRLILKTYILGGDMVLLFDDGLLDDSGRVVIYEPDEIQNTTESALKSHYGADARQSLGRVYNRNGRFIGCIVSRSQRGADVFQPDACYFLYHDPRESLFDSKWLMPRNVFRVAQGRGTPPLASSLATILDLEDLCGFEIAAAKKNAQTLAQVLESGGDSTEDAAPPSAFDPGTDFEGLSEAEINEAIKAEAQAATQTITLDRIAAAGCTYQVMPKNFRAELLDTKHPNSNTPEFINWLAGRSAAPFGLSREFATLAPSGESYRANQLFSERAFEDCQKFLEGVCDWVFWRWSVWASRRGLIPELSFDVMSKVDWAWPRMAELDENSYQDAVQKKLQNMTGTYREILGADWKNTLQTVRDEIAWCKSNNLPHPAYKLISGGEATGADVQE